MKEISWLKYVCLFELKWTFKTENQKLNIFYKRGNKESLIIYIVPHLLFIFGWCSLFSLRDTLQKKKEIFNLIEIKNTVLVLALFKI